MLTKFPNPIASLKKMILKLNKFMTYNGYLLVMDSTYYQQSLSIFLQFRQVSLANYWNIISMILCCMESFIYFGYFIFVYKMATKMETIYYTKHSAIIQKLRVIFEDYDLRNPKARGFSFIICLRKMIHCIILVFLHDYIWIEILFLVLMNISYLLALGIIRPYFNMGRLKREVFIEFSYLLCHIFVGLMQFYQSDSDLKYNLGWGVIGGSMGIIGVYLLDGIQMMIKKVKDALRKIRDKFYRKFIQKSNKVAPSHYIYHHDHPVIKKPKSRTIKMPKTDLKRQMTPFFR